MYSKCVQDKGTLKLYWYGAKSPYLMMGVASGHSDGHVTLF